ncbi:GNAT family N-acetyltransferase [Pseudodesulfovibrio sp. JC047]|uniref:GNAT family N-acetyltransferase n=1 Tax=Pseudodesulfovibrio sp. JC047 TaxID=2683199 RepID=UPI0013D692C1|nr:GNAT family N-acetyltransferase [Pseudodesulfovibrio sp. JC047]NDV18286.1 GNAT family N-acetyltransferase [Pseudodesulfovibrio sp. JC047]
MYRYADNKDLDMLALQELFLALDWDSGNHPEQLTQAIQSSTSVFTAWDGEKLVGLVNVLSDGHMAAYIHYMLVHPAYQGHGIGKHLMDTVAEKYADVPHKVLVAYGEAIGFYEQCGYHCAEGTAPMFMTSLKI